MFNYQLAKQQIMIGNEMLEWQNIYSWEKQLVQTQHTKKTKNSFGVQKALKTCDDIMNNNLILIL